MGSVDGSDHDRAAAVSRILQGPFVQRPAAVVITIHRGMKIPRALKPRKASILEHVETDPLLGLRRARSAPSDIVARTMVRLRLTSVDL